MATRRKKSKRKASFNRKHPRTATGRFRKKGGKRRTTRRRRKARR